MAEEVVVIYGTEYPIQVTRYGKSWQASGQCKGKHFSRTDASRNKAIWDWRDWALYLICE